MVVISAGSSATARGELLLRKRDFDVVVLAPEDEVAGEEVSSRYSTTRSSTRYAFFITAPGSSGFACTATLIVSPGPKAPREGVACNIVVYASAPRVEPEEGEEGGMEGT